MPQLLICLVFPYLDVNTCGLGFFEFLRCHQSAAGIELGNFLISGSDVSSANSGKKSKKSSCSGPARCGIKVKSDQMRERLNAARFRCINEMLYTSTSQVCGSL